MSNPKYEDISEYLRIKALIDGDRSDEIIRQAHEKAMKEIEEERNTNKNKEKNEEEQSRWQRKKKKILKGSI